MAAQETRGIIALQNVLQPEVVPPEAEATARQANSAVRQVEGAPHPLGFSHSCSEITRPVRSDTPSTALARDMVYIQETDPWPELRLEDLEVLNVPGMQQQFLTQEPELAQQTLISPSQISAASSTQQAEQHEVSLRGEYSVRSEERQRDTMGVFQKPHPKQQDCSSASRKRRASSPAQKEHSSKVVLRRSSSHDSTPTLALHDFVHLVQSHPEAAPSSASQERRPQAEQVLGAPASTESPGGTTSLASHGSSDQALSPRKQSFPPLSWIFRAVYDGAVRITDERKREADMASTSQPQAKAGSSHSVSSVELARLPEASSTGPDADLSQVQLTDKRDQRQEPQAEGGSMQCPPEEYSAPGSRLFKTQRREGSQHDGRRALDTGSLLAGLPARSQQEQDQLQVPQISQQISKQAQGSHSVMSGTGSVALQEQHSSQKPSSCGATFSTFQASRASDSRSEFEMPQPEVVPGEADSVPTFYSSVPQLQTPPNEVVSRKSHSPDPKHSVLDLKTPSPGESVGLQFTPTPEPEPVQVKSAALDECPPAQPPAIPIAQPGSTAIATHTLEQGTLVSLQREEVPLQDESFDIPPGSLSVLENLPPADIPLPVLTVQDVRNVTGDDSLASPVLADLPLLPSVPLFEPAMAAPTQPVPQHAEPLPDVQMEDSSDEDIFDPSEVRRSPSQQLYFSTP
ncbi:hypothetical protein V5799_004160 [Amblyomma americanum]|uniref:Uncharacterized protein n=1 Tax=Amblyomma americanum TaxID=6943 RepID=A0AAQ4D6W0_AMBAM